MPNEQSDPPKTNELPPNCNDRYTERVNSPRDESAGNEANSPNSELCVAGSSAYSEIMTICHHPGKYLGTNRVNRTWRVIPDRQ
jgi:hypothetical protein